MALKRNIEFMNEEIYSEIQRLSNTYANGNKSAFIRLACMTYEEQLEKRLDAESALRESKQEIELLKKQLKESE